MKLQSLILLCLVWLTVMPSAQAQENDCRLKLQDLQPIITRFNPYFSNHQWSLENRMELARMGNERLLMITQDGCKRHHVVFTLVVDNRLIEDKPEFWVNETSLMMRKVFHDRGEYQEFGVQFEDLFTEKFMIYGLGRRFNFPIGTRNFICEIVNQPGQGARLIVEVVEYIFKDEETVIETTNPSEDDDGWIGNERP